MFGRKTESRPMSDDEREHAEASNPGHGDDPRADAVDPPDPDATQGMIDALAGERDEYKDKWLRAMAEYQNYQRRAIQNEIEAKRQGITAVLMSIVPVLDAFDMALGSGMGQKADQASAATLDGVRAIQQSLLTALASHGVGVIHPKPNDEFDPNLHSGIMQAPAEGVQPGRVSLCVQVGYQLGDRVIRSAKVAIAPTPSDSSASGG